MYLNIDKIESIMEAKNGKAVICIKESASMPAKELAEDEDIEVDDALFVEESFSEIVSMLEAKL